VGGLNLLSPGGGGLMGGIKVGRGRASITRAPMARETSRRRMLKSILGGA